MARQFGRVVLAGFATVAAIGAFHYALAEMANPPTVPATPATPKSQVMRPPRTWRITSSACGWSPIPKRANAIAKRAQDRATNPAVKEFAQTLAERPRAVSRQTCRS